MREDLAREFPEAVRAAAWSRDRIGGRRPALWTEPVVWATISAIGAGFLVGAVAQAVVVLANEAFQALRSPLPFALGIPGVMMFCERSGGAGFPLLPGPSQCTPSGFLVSLWPQFIGIGLGIAFSRAFTARGAGVNSVLRVAGAYAFAQFVVGQVWAATAAQSLSALASGLTLAAGMAAAAVAAGVVAAQLPQGIRNAAIVAGIWLLTWLTRQIPLGLQGGVGTTVPPEFVGPMTVTIAATPIAAALLVLSAAITSRARFIPRDTA